MCTREVKISNVMSLDDKVRIIYSYHNLDTEQEKKEFVDSHAQIKRIIENKSKILSSHSLMQAKLHAVKNAFNLHISMSDESKKITLLEKVIHEWFQRFINHKTINAINYRVMRERVDIAMHILNITKYNPSEVCLTGLRISCARRPTKYGSVTDTSLSLSMKEITRYVLAQEGISKEKAESTYGIQVYDEEWTDMFPAVHCRNMMEPIESCSLEPCEIIDVDEYDECESSEKSKEDGDAPASTESMEGNKLVKDLKNLKRIGDATKLAEDSCKRFKYDTVAGTSIKDSMTEDTKDDLGNLNYDGGISISTKVNIADQLIEDNKDHLKHLNYHNGNISSSTGRTTGFHTTEDNKYALQYLKHNTQITTLTTDQNEEITSKQDALEYLKPLRKFMLSQENERGLELLTEMEAFLIKSE